MKLIMPIASILLGVVLGPKSRVFALSTGKQGLSFVSRYSQSNSVRPLVRVDAGPTLLHRLHTNSISQLSHIRRYNASCKRNFGTTLHDAAVSIETDGSIPMTFLSGFLGSGKTTALKNVLENNEGVKVGVIVNDVASVNIDAKLISNPSEVTVDGGTIELQNGCACCTLVDELMSSVQSLAEGRDLDAIIVELSGVADPVNVKDNWENAKLMDHPATKLAKINKIVTVVDACTFGTDWMTWNTTADRDGWVDENVEHTEEKQVPELLAEQVEAADILLINKIDLAGKAQVEIASAVAKGLNKEASVYEVSFGKVEPSEILGMMDAKVEKKGKEKSKGDDKTSSVDATSKDPIVDHSHEHDHASADCSDPNCADPTHDHSHSHEHAASECNDPTCTDPTHDHSHSHEHASDAAHDHSHSHNHGSTSIENLGIINFVYKANRPFNTSKLLAVLNLWPIPIKDDLDIGQLKEAAEEGIQTGEDVAKNPFMGVLRSKGFAWLAPAQWAGPMADVWRHDTAMFWSQAGKHFGITTAGKWWGSINKDQMKAYFAKNMKEYHRILDEDWASVEFGDRRQEIVFIGASIDEEEITKKLDACLLDDDELDEYRKQVRKTGENLFATEA